MMAGSNLRWVLGLALGLVLGLGAGWWLASSGLSEGAGGGAIAAKGRAVVPVTRGERELPAAAAPIAEGARTQAPAPDPAQLSDAELDGLVAAVEPTRIEHRSGTGVISGRIVDPDGAGVSDVVVRAVRRDSVTRTTDPSYVGRMPAALDDLDKVVRDAARRHAETRAKTSEAVTAPDGSYRFEGLAEGSYGISAYKLDYVVEPRAGSSSTVGIGARLDLVAHAVVRVPVDIRFAAGGVPESAVISCELKGGNGRPTHYEWSPEANELRLRPGKYEITALAELLEVRRYAEAAASALRSESEDVELIGGVAPQLLALVLSGRSGIHGRVTFETGAVEISSASVHLLAMPAVGELDSIALSQSRERERVSGGSEYAFLDLDPGRYALGVVATHGAAPSAVQIVEVGSGIITCDLEVPPVDLSQYLSVEVLDSNGARLDDIDFTFNEQRGDGGSSGWGARALRGPNGVHVVTIPTEARANYFGEGREGITYSIEVRNEEHGAKTIELAAGTTEIQVSFVVPARLEILIAGYAGSEYAGRLSLNLRSLASSKRWHGWGEEVGLSGIQVHEAVEPGEYSLDLYLGERPGLRSGRRTLVHFEPLTLLPGPNSAQVAIPTLYPVTVRCGEGIKGGVHMKPRDAEEGMASELGAGWIEISDQRLAEFLAVPAGSYTVSAAGVSLDIEVPCGEVVLQKD